MVPMARDIDFQRTAQKWICRAMHRRLSEKTATSITVLVYSSYDSQIAAAEESWPYQVDI